MRINLKYIPPLDLGPRPESIDISPSETLASLLAKLEIPQQEVMMAFADDKMLGFDTEIQVGSTVTLFSFISGG